MPMPMSWWLRFVSRIRNTGRRRPRIRDTGFGTKGRWNSPLSMPHPRSLRVVASSRRESCSLSSSRALSRSLRHVCAYSCDVWILTSFWTSDEPRILPHPPHTLQTRLVGKRTVGRCRQCVDGRRRAGRRSTVVRVPTVVRHGTTCDDGTKSVVVDDSVVGIVVTLATETRKSASTKQRLDVCGSWGRVGRTRRKTL
jgi:hypothetical protein